MQIVTDQFQQELKEHGDYHFPILISSEKLSGYESGSFLWHWHPEIELTLITKNQMTYRVNNTAFLLRQGEALFGNAGSLHSGCMHKNQDCEYTSVTFDPKLLYGYDNSIIYIKYVNPIIQNFSLPAVHFDLSQDWHGEIIELLKDIIRIGTEQYETYEIDILIRLNHFWKLLFLHSDSQPAITAYDKRNYERLRSLLSYIDEHYASKLTLEDIAAHIHLCKSECCRMFKRYMKISLFEFILEYRIEKSIYYLTNSNDTIADIAERVGFHDSNYFSKVFLRIKGCSPTKYKKQMAAK